MHRKHIKVSSITIKQTIDERKHKPIIFLYFFSASNRLLWFCTTESRTKVNLFENCVLQLFAAADIVCTRFFLLLFLLNSKKLLAQLNAIWKIGRCCCCCWTHVLCVCAILNSFNSAGNAFLLLLLNSRIRNCRSNTMLYVVYFFFLF